MVAVVFLVVAMRLEGVFGWLLMGCYVVLGGCYGVARVFGVVV